MQKTSKKCHWFGSTTGHSFYAVKIMNRWRFISKKGFILYEAPQLNDLKFYVKHTFGFSYLGYM